MTDADIELTDKQKTILKLWLEGKTSGVIGQTLRITRNSVVGVIHRLKTRGIKVDPDGLHKAKGGKPPKRENPKVYLRPERIKRSIETLTDATDAPASIGEVRPAPERLPRGGASHRAAKARTAPRYINRIAPSRDGERWVPLLDVSHNGCRWPRGEHEYAFCNHVQTAGSAYCAEHKTMSITTSYLTIRDRTAA